MWDLNTMKQMNDEAVLEYKARRFDELIRYIVGASDSEFFVFFNRVVDEFLKRSGIYARL